MFLVSLTYVKPIEDIEAHMSAHAAFLDEHYEKGKFIVSGRKQPRTGGVILANVETKEEMESILKADPFHIHGLAEYELTQFTPTKYHSDFASFVG